MAVFFPGARGSTLYVPAGGAGGGGGGDGSPESIIDSALGDYTTTGNVPQGATGLTTYDPWRGGPIYTELEDPKRWTVRDPSGWANLSRWIKDNFPTLSTTTQFQNRVDQVAARFEMNTGQLATAGLLKAYEPMLQALQALALGYHELPPIFALATTPVGSVAAPTAGAPTSAEQPTGAEQPTTLPTPMAAPTAVNRPITDIPGSEQWFGSAATGAPAPAAPGTGGYYTNPYTGEQLPMVPQGEITYYLNTIYGPKEVDYFSALLFAQAASPVQEYALQTIPLQDPLESVWGKRYLDVMGGGEGPQPPGWRPGLGNIQENVSALQDYRQLSGGYGQIPAGPWQSIQVPPPEDDLPEGMTMEQYAQRYSPGPAWELVKDQDEYGNERWSWAMDPHLANALRSQLIGSGAEQPEIPIFTPDTLNQFLTTAQGAGSYGSGSGSRITFDREEIKQYVESVWRAYLLEQLDDSTAYSYADDYIDDATSFYQEGGHLDLEAWIVHKIRGNARHRLLYRYKPGALSELDYIKGFLTAAAQTGVPERLYEPRVTSAMRSGASAEGFALRASRTPEVFASNPNTFISRLAQTAAASVGGVD